MRVLHHILFLTLTGATALTAQAFSPEAGALGRLSSAAGEDTFVLGVTTLSAVRQVYARRNVMELLVNAKVPRELVPAPRWKLGDSVLEPRYRVDGTAGYYTLYFDTGERLILAVDDQPRERLTRKDFQQRFPGARTVRQASRATVLEVELEACVTLSAFFDSVSDTLVQVGYGYTCGGVRPISH